MSNLFRFNDLLVEGVIGGDPPRLNEVERRLEEWMADAVFNTIQVNTRADFADGSSSAPSIAFTSDTNKNDGIYHSNTFGVIGFTSGGVARFAVTAFGAQMQSGQFTLQAGTVGSPAITITGDTNTGLYQAAANQVDWSGGGTRGGFLWGGGLRTADGSASVPAVAPISNADLGIYWTGSEMRVSINNATKYYFTASYLRADEYYYQYGADDNGMDLRDTAASAITKYIRFQDSGGGRDGYMGMVGGHLYMTSDVGGNYIRILSTNVVDVGDGAGIVQIRGSNPRFPNITTTGSAANARITSTVKEIREVTSMGAYKDDRRAVTLEEAERLLQVPAISWVSTAPADADEGDRRFVGWVAEHFSEAGLDDLLEWNLDGSARSIHYDRVPAYMMVLIERLWNEVFPDEPRPAKSAPDSPGAGPRPDRARDPESIERGPGDPDRPAHPEAGGDRAADIGRLLDEREPNNAPPE